MNNQPYHPQPPPKPAYRADYPILKNKIPPTATEEVLEPEHKELLTLLQGLLECLLRSQAQRSTEQ